MLAVVKHAVDANDVFQQHSRPAHGACNTVQLLQCKTQLHYQSYGPQQRGAELKLLHKEFYEVMQ